MGAVLTAEAAGSIIRNIRERKGITRNDLAERTGIGARTIYALETGRSENFGLANYLKLLSELDLEMSIENSGHIAAPTVSLEEKPEEGPKVPWKPLDDRWALPEVHHE